MYRIDHDAGSDTLRLRLTGFWTPAVMDRFAAEFLRRIAMLGTRPFVILSDCRDYPVQSAEVGLGWSRLLGADSKVTRPYAVVVGTTLNKLQAERALTAPGLRVFLDMGEATAWLEERRRTLA